MDRTFVILSSYQRFHNQAVSLFDIMDILNNDHSNSQSFRAMVIISLHTSLEVLFKDIISNYIENHSDSMNTKDISETSVKVSSIYSGTVYHEIVSALLRSAPNKQAIFLKYRHIIKNTLSLNVLDIEENFISLIREFSAARNLIVHNNRRVDSEYLKNVPWKKQTYKVGDDLVISSSDYVGMINAIFELVNKTILTAFIPKPYSIELKGTEFDYFEGIDPFDVRGMRRRYREWLVDRGRRYGPIQPIFGENKADVIHRLMRIKTQHDF